MNKYTIINNTPYTPVLGNTDSIMQEKSAIVWDNLDIQEMEYLWEQEQEKIRVMQEMIEQYGY